MLAIITNNSIRPYIYFFNKSISHFAPYRLVYFIINFFFSKFDKYRAYVTFNHNRLFITRSTRPIYMNKSVYNDCAHINQKYIVNWYVEKTIHPAKTIQYVNVCTLQINYILVKKSFFQWRNITLVLIMIV